jgi:hypothetical protein
MPFLRQSFSSTLLWTCLVGAALFLIVCTASVCAQGSLVAPPYSHSYGIRKATPKHLFMFLPLTSFADPQGLATAKMKSRDDTATAKDDDEVVVYGVNSGRHQLIYNTSMWALAMYGTKGSGKDQFDSPKGVACDQDGHVFVADWGNNRIVHLFNPKKRVRWVGAFNGSEKGGARLSGPLQVALDGGGRLYVSDPGNRRIAVFRYDGTLLRTIPAGGAFSFVNGPTTLAVADGATRFSYFHDEQCIFCCDSGGKRIWKIGLDGMVLAKANIPAGYTACYGAIDYYHNFLVTDTEKGCILKFDRNLVVLDTFGSEGTGDNQFIEPRGIAIYKRYGQVFVAEKNGAQYYWTGTSLKTALCAVGGGRSITLSTYLTEYSFVTLRRVIGRDTACLLDRRMVLPGPQETIFTGPAAAIDLSKGSMDLKIEPTYSSFRYYSWHYPVRVGFRE